MGAPEKGLLLLLVALPISPSPLFFFFFFAVAPPVSSSEEQRESREE